MPRLRVLFQAQSSRNWAIYDSRNAPARLVGFVDDAPDKQTAIERAIKEHKIPVSGRRGLVAQLRA